MEVWPLVPPPLPRPNLSGEMCTCPAGHLPDPSVLAPQTTVCVECRVEVRE